MAILFLVILLLPRLMKVYHTFHNEVDFYKTHWWKCNGPCQKRHPYYGIVKRSMNRAPGPSDFWYNDHQRSCGGTFSKIKEPEKKEQQKRKDKTVSKGKNTSGIASKKITTFFLPSTSAASKGRFFKVYLLETKYCYSVTTKSV